MSTLFEIHEVTAICKEELIVIKYVREEKVLIGNMEKINLEQTHTLVLVSTYLSGAEEWLCPACGRRILKTRLPQEQLIVLVAGDEQSKHNDGGQNQVTQANISLNMSTLAPWLDWINQVDFDKLEDGNTE